MRSSLLLLVWPVVAFSLYLVASYVTRRHKQSAEARRLGCKTAPTYPSVDPLGINNVVKLIKSNNAGQLPEHIKSRFDDVSKIAGQPLFTFQGHVFRNWLYATCDPKNIQAILATQFKEFELGPIRFGTFSPL